MRIPKTEVERRHQVALAYFRKNPTASVAKLNTALRSGELTGKPEKMLNIATGYKWRKEAVTTPELPLNESGERDPAVTFIPTATFIDVQTAVSPEAISQVLAASGPQSTEELVEAIQAPTKAIPCGDDCPGCNFCRAESESLPETLNEHAASIERT